MKKKIIVWAIVALIAVIILLQSFVVVEPGQSGVIVTLGAVSDTVLAEGFHLKAPFAQSVVQINNRTQKVDVTGAAASKDLQTVTCEVAVNYRVLNASSASLYKNVGNNYEAVIISPAIQESIKAVTAQFTAEQLITERQSVSEQVKAQLLNKINPYGLTVEIFNIVNFNFSEEFNAAVEAKQTAEQQALKAEQDLNRIKIEAQQKVTQAQAEADSIKLIQDTLKTSPEYIEYMKWQKWDGVLPKVMTGSDGSTIVDVGNVLDPSVVANSSAAPQQ